MLRRAEANDGESIMARGRDWTSGRFAMAPSKRLLALCLSSFLVSKLVLAASLLAQPHLPLPQYSDIL